MDMWRREGTAWSSKCPVVVVLFAIAVRVIWNGDIVLFPFLALRPYQHKLLRTVQSIYFLAQLDASDSAAFAQSLGIPNLGTPFFTPVQFCILLCVLVLGGHV